MSKQILTTQKCIQMQLPISFLGCRVGRLTKVRFWLYVLQVIDHLSPRLAAFDEVGVEEDDDNPSFQYESGNDTTANEATVESSYTWSRANLSQSRYHYLLQTMDTLSPPRPNVLLLNAISCVECCCWSRS